MHDVQRSVEIKLKSCPVNCMYSRIHEKGSPVLLDTRVVTCILYHLSSHFTSQGMDETLVSSTAPGCRVASLGL